MAEINIRSGLWLSNATHERILVFEGKGWYLSEEDSLGWATDNFIKGSFWEFDLPNEDFRKLTLPSEYILTDTQMKRN